MELLLDSTSTTTSRHTLPRLDGPTSRLMPYTTAGLGRMFADVWHEQAVRLDELRDAVRSYVHRMRDDGLPPERVLVSLKTEITRGDSTHLPPSLADDLTHDGTLRASTYEHVFSWYLEAYFEMA